MCHKPHPKKEITLKCLNTADMDNSVSDPDTVHRFFTHSCCGHSFRFSAFFRWAARFLTHRSSSEIFGLWGIIASVKDSALLKVRVNYNPVVCDTHSYPANAAGLPAPLQSLKLFWEQSLYWTFCSAQTGNCPFWLFNSSEMMMFSVLILK